MPSTAGEETLDFRLQIKERLIEFQTQLAADLIEAARIRDAAGILQTSVLPDQVVVLTQQTQAALAQTKSYVDQAVTLLST